MSRLRSRLSGEMLRNSSQNRFRLSLWFRLAYSPIPHNTQIRASHSLRTPELNDLSHPTAELKPQERKLRNRLLKLIHIMHKKDLGYERRAQKIFNLYQSECADLLDDIQTSKELRKKSHGTASEPGNKSLPADDMMKAIMDGLWRMLPSTLNVQALTLDLLITNALGGNLILTCETLLQLFAQPHIPNANYPILEVKSILEQLKSIKGHRDIKFHELQSQICNICLNFAIEFGRPLITALLLNRCFNHPVYIDSSTIEKVLLSLSVTHSVLGNYQYYTLLKLFEREEVKAVLDAALYLRIITNMCKGNGIPFFPNVILHKAIKLDSFMSDQSDLSALNDLISLNVDNGNIKKAQEIWKLGCDLDAEFPYNSITSFRKLFLSCELSDKAELLTNHLPEDLLTDPVVFDIILAFFGLNPQFNNDFIELSKFVAPPISRPVLTSLLISFLSRNSKKEVNLLTKAITNSQGGLMPLDVDAMVKHCLENSEINEALRIVFHNNISATSMGFVRITQHILKNALNGSIFKLEPEDPLYEPFKRQVMEINADIFAALPESPSHLQANLVPRLQNDLILNLIIVKLMKLGNDPILRDLTLVLLTYLCKKDGCGVGRTFFVRSTAKTGQVGIKFDFVKFGLPKHFMNLVKIDGSNRVKCIEVLLDHAKLENNISSIQWCVQELRKAGLQVEDINKYYFSDLVEQDNL